MIKRVLVSMLSSLRTTLFYLTKTVFCCAHSEQLKVR